MFEFWIVSISCKNDERIFVLVCFSWQSGRIHRPLVVDSLSNTLKPRGTHLVGFSFIVCDHFSLLLVSFTAVCITLLFVVLKLNCLHMLCFMLWLRGRFKYISLAGGNRVELSKLKTQLNRMVESTYSWKSPISNKKKPAVQLFVKVIVLNFSNLLNKFWDMRPM